jgi:hypothetical protein
MADMDSPLLKKAKRERGGNWTLSAVLEDLVQSNFDALNSKFNTTQCNEKKAKLWVMITENINANGQNGRTVKQVQTTWSNLQAQTKTAWGALQADIVKTGGGPATYVVPEHLTGIVDLCKDLPSFSGLVGVESTFGSSFPSTSTSGGLHTIGKVYTIQ